MEDTRYKKLMATISKKLSREMREPLKGRNHHICISAFVDLISDFYIERFPVSFPHGTEKFPDVIDAGRNMRNIRFKDFCNSVQEKLDV